VDKESRVEAVVGLVDTLAASNHVDAPPKEGFAKVVGVSCVSPEAGADDRALFGGVVTMSLELDVAHDFEEHSEEPHAGANDLPGANLLVGGGVLHDDDGRHVVNIAEGALHNKDKCPRPKQPADGSTVLPSLLDDFVAVVFSFVSAPNVDGKSERPDENHGSNEDHHLIELISFSVH